MENQATWSTKDRIIGAGLIAVLLCAIGFLVYGHINAFQGPGLGISPDDPDCEPTQALVTNKFETGGKSIAYSLTYTYRTPDGTTFDQEEHVDINTFALTEIGDSVGVCFLKSQPEKSIILSNDQGSESILHLIVLDLAVLVAIFFLIRSMLKKRKQQTA